MTSEKQIAANRANARGSTGPKTKSGKVRSRMNACRHGLTAETVVIRGEDPNKFNVLCAELEEEFKPRSMLEVELVGRLAGVLWRLRRLPMFEAALIEARRAEVEPFKTVSQLAAAAAGEAEDEKVARKITGKALIQDSRNQDTLGKLSRYEATLMNAFHRSLQQLLFLQDRRRGEEERNQTVEAIPLPTNHRDAA